MFDLSSSLDDCTPINEKWILDVRGIMLYPTGQGSLMLKNAIFSETLRANVSSRAVYMEACSREGNMICTFANS